jgi:TPP-dependent pyruvate/acetoin dehydrogenase alpha subunit
MTGDSGSQWDDRAQLERMCLIRQFETRAVQLYSGGEIKGSVHSSVGQEAVAVGICSSLGIEDYIVSTHRGHGHAIAKGADPGKMLAELMGRENGYCRGKGGSMHVTDVSLGMLGANGIVGASIPIAVGAAYSTQVRGENRVAVAFFGDGALAEGALWEGMNLAALWKLPVVFVAENNQFAVTLRINEGFSARNVIDVPTAFGVPSESVDGMDLLAVREAAARAVGRARAGEGPSFIEALTYRFTGHSRGDPSHGTYRTKEEVQEWLERDPLNSFAAKTGLSEELEELLAAAETRIESAVEFARGGDFPSVASAYEDVYPSEVLAR